MAASTAADHSGLSSDKKAPRLLQCRLRTFGRCTRTSRKPRPAALWRSATAQRMQQLRRWQTPCSSTACRSAAPDDCLLLPRTPDDTSACACRTLMQLVQTEADAAVVNRQVRVTAYAPVAGCRRRLLQASRPTAWSNTETLLVESMLWYCAGGGGGPGGAPGLTDAQDALREHTSSQAGSSGRFGTRRGACQHPTERLSCTSLLEVPCLNT